MWSRVLLYNLVAALALFTLWIVVVMIDRRLVHIPMLKYESYIGLATALTVFLFANYYAYESRKRRSRLMLSIATAVVVTSVWVPLAIMSMLSLMDAVGTPH